MLLALVGHSTIDRATFSRRSTVPIFLLPSDTPPTYSGGRGGGQNYGIGKEASDKLNVELVLTARNIERKDGHPKGVLDGCGVFDILHIRSKMTLASLQCRDGTRRVFADHGRHCLHEARGAVRRSVSRVKGDLHPFKNRS